MGFVKKLVIQGFKSFPRRTEIILENAINVIVGENGSGKSNITDAICFVLGRISIKSIRAAKAANLLFSGNQTYKGSSEAFVEITFDNSDMAFGVNNSEISIRRTLKKNGLSTYRINNEIKTRQELIELLARSGIDPNGFNIIMQGDIQSLTKIGGDERRKIVEDVAGISIYESRKHQSTLELNRTEEKLKEISAVLRERNAQLRNLEKDRQDALSHQKFEESLKRHKATLISKIIKEKEKELWSIEKVIENNQKDIQERRQKTKEKNIIIDELREKIDKINKDIQLSMGEEQENLFKEISDLNGKLAGHGARKENFENRIKENSSKEVSLKEKVKEIEEEISRIQTVGPEIKKKQDILKESQNKFDILEKKRRQFYITRSELLTTENKKEENSKKIIGYVKELELIEKNINQTFGTIKHEKNGDKALSLKNKIMEKIKENILRKNKIDDEILEIEKRNAILEQAMKRETKMKEDISGLETCPTCKSKITEEHKNHVITNSNKLIGNAKSELSENFSKKDELKKIIEGITEDTANSEKKVKEIEIDLLKIKAIDEKKYDIVRITDKQKESEKEREELSKQVIELKKKFEELKNIEKEYDEERLKLHELSSFNIDVDVDTTLKNREAERIKTEIKALHRDTEETTIELKNITEKYEEVKSSLKIKEAEEQKLYEKSQKLFTIRNELQDKQKAIETDVMGLQHEIRAIEEKLNSINIQKAQHQAQLEALNFDSKEFDGIEILNISIEQARAKIQEIQMKLTQFGNVNLKALEIYDQVKLACEQITERMNTIISEKAKIEEIMKEIDKKKKKAFVKTLEELNVLFSRNFSQLSKKGEIFLELDNKDDPFIGGLNIILKVGKGKYFDILSLSGGEKTLAVISLLFAIQEYRPYCFYVLDEIDAALDKHNSELLAALIKKYKLSGQYIIVTHNDALISEATTLYGVSMQDKISKIISLKL